MRGAEGRCEFGDRTGEVTKRGIGRQSSNERSSADV